MTPIEKTLNKKTIDHGSSNNKKTIDHGNGLTVRQADKIIEQVSDLINDPQYRPFFYKKLYQLSPSEFLNRADKARSAKVLDHGRLFVCLLK